MCGFWKVFGEKRDERPNSIDSHGGQQDDGFYPEYMSPCNIFEIAGTLFQNASGRNMDIV